MQLQQSKKRPETTANRRKVTITRRWRNQVGASKLPLLIVLLLLLAGLSVVAANRQGIIDWWRLRDYTAPAPVASLANQDAMTDYARKVFYVNSPDIRTKANFSSACPSSKAEQTIVLGCYHSDQAGIYLLNVTDPRLQGVEQVTAAHEMLHAAYDRLSSADRKKIDGMLLDYYNKDLTDERIKKTIDAYKKSEPNDLVNEMHSIFGTEVANLPSGLEAYYTKYFTKRSVITDAAAKYQAEFTSRQAAVAQADAQLSSLKAQIDSEEADLKTKQQTISDTQSNLVNLRNNGNTAAYNAGVPAYNALVDDYNSEVQAVQSLISQYNSLVASRNAIALEEDQLVNNLSSSATPIN
jgi:hypothetical protein